MYTPQRKAARPGIGFMTPRSEAARGTAGKGKAVALFDGPPPPPPPVGSLDGSGAREVAEENMDDWRRFREAGFLNEAEMERRDREALMERAARLEKELFDYQYNMGLLLIEKKEWNSQYEGLRQALAEAQEILKREQSVHVIALSEAEGRREALTKALSVEKQCVADVCNTLLLSSIFNFFVSWVIHLLSVQLEKVFRDLQKEHLQIKQTSEAKLSEAKSLAVGIKEKSVEVEEKLHAAESKLAEAERKSLELDMKLQELEARESVLERERLSLSTEREAHVATFYKQREDLHEWEKRLQKGEERLTELRKTLNHKEEKTNEQEIFHKQKEKELEEAQKKIDLQFLKLKEREDDVNNRLSDLTVKEKAGILNVDSVGRTIMVKEKELLSLEKKLSDRERVEVQELLDEQRAILDAKMLEREQEMEEKRKNLDNELRSKVATVEVRVTEIGHREEILVKRELALDKKLEKVKEKEKDLESRLKILKESEKSMKAEQKKLEMEKQQLLTDGESLQLLRSDCEKMRDEIAVQERQIGEKRESLKITNVDRLEHLRLQAELKQELEKCRRREEYLLRESEDLKQEREKFEKEWQVLEEKRAHTSKQLKEIVEEREKLEKLQCTEGERLKEKERAMQEFVQRELEAARQEKESFEQRMKQEQLLLSEKAQIEHDQMIQSFQSQRQQLEADLMAREEEMERSLRERETAFKELKDRELKDINNLKDVAQRESEVMQSERCVMIKEKQDVAENKRLLEEQQFGMQKDIKELEMLSKKLRDQRQQVIGERNHFLNFVEKHKSCKNCGEIVREFVLSDLQPSEIENAETFPLPRLANEIHRDNQVVVNGGGVNVNASPGELDVGSTDSRGRMSWLHKCTSKIFSKSPNKKIEQFSNPTLPEEGPSPSPPAEEGKAKGSDIRVSKVEVSVSADHRDGPRPSLSAADDSTAVQQLQSVGNTVDNSYSVSIDDHSFIDSKVPETPGDSEQSAMKSSRNKRGRKPKAGPGRTRSVKAVVEDAKLFLGESLEEPKDQGVSSHIEKTASKRKRQRAPTESEQDGGDSEGHSDSVTTVGRRKRQQKAASVMPSPGQTRYNLRRHKIAGTASATQAPSGLMMEKKDGSVGGDSGVEPVAVPKTACVLPQGVASISGKSTDLVHVTVRKSVEPLQDKDKMARFDATDADDPAVLTKHLENAELSEEVSGIQEYRNEEDEEVSTIYEEDEDEHDEDELEQPGEVSIGKKIWTFFTT
ncbi:hypothetical protein Tsubulata_033842 [Turnera subulata]|uniref:Nuclear matrix constituent protein 1-like protein n=1 Tax=Turnera subulata TaxID=218843 RepID=A0A9Q0JBI3_9ROSI|nr:hypothetical protein Tsubulata_033842 [Turnera subulata]